MSLVVDVNGAIYGGNKLQCLILGHSGHLVLEAKQVEHRSTSILQMT